MKKLFIIVFSVFLVTLLIGNPNKDNSAVKNGSTTNQLEYWLKLLQAFVLIFGIPVAIRQLYLQTRAIKLQNESFRLSNYMSMMKLALDNDNLLIVDVELINFWDEDKLPKDLSKEYRLLQPKYRKYYFYFSNLINHQEKAYILWKQKCLDNYDYRAILQGLRELIGFRMFKLWWPQIKNYYRSDFVSHVERIKDLNEDDFISEALSNKYK